MCSSETEFVQFQNRVCQVKLLSILRQHQQHDFQLQMQLWAFAGREGEAGCAVLQKLPLKCHTQCPPPALPTAHFYLPPSFTLDFIFLMTLQPILAATGCHSCPRNRRHLAPPTVDEAPSRSQVDRPLTRRQLRSLLLPPLRPLKAKFHQANQLENQLETQGGNQFVLVRNKLETSQKLVGWVGN